MRFLPKGLQMDAVTSCTCLDGCCDIPEGFGGVLLLSRGLKHLLKCKQHCRLRPVAQCLLWPLSKKRSAVLLQVRTSGSYKEEECHL